MWLYMVSLYGDASLEMRRKRRPYLAISLVLLVLHCAADICWAIQMYSLLFAVPPGLEDYESYVEILIKYDEKFGAPASLIADLALRLADAVLVGFFCSSTIAQLLTSSTALPMLYCLGWPPLDHGPTNLDLPRKSRYVPGFLHDFNRRDKTL